MLTREIARQVRLLEIVVRRLVTDQLAGQYESVFKGQGIEFDEVRAYQTGDDVRLVDWKVTARSGDLHIKRFVEERELTVIVAVDVSGSFDLGTASRSKRAVAAEVAAVLAFSAIRNNDRVGLLMFSEDVEHYIPPRKGRRHVLRVISDVLSHRSRSRGTRLSAALEFVRHVQRRRAVVFLLSDFLDDGFEQPLRLLRMKHDVIPILMQDPFELEVPAIDAVVPMRDLETGETTLVDLGDRRTREALAEQRRRRGEDLDALFRRLKLDLVRVRTDQPWVPEIAGWFRRRAARSRGR
ncbi:MAG: DUF58 domain-containing protein [Deltaproteobacteria bacterium]|nr:MAG: DUF58 domain-containing protein [Deltaproteobacteria bacterium]